MEFASDMIWIAATTTAIRYSHHAMASGHPWIGGFLIAISLYATANLIHYRFKQR